MSAVSKSVFHISFDRCRFSVILLFLPDFGETKYRGNGMLTCNLPHDLSELVLEKIPQVPNRMIPVGIFSCRRFW